ncbi:hypothetical protein VP1G_09649 [Cytospora mali]|uniref:Hypervirulence associated protein TUDOR domain-containing protein n=1 Tax=Cytospora mali TaxID=578113 RepID=A0A194VFH6_CYTMA|nr:hypothetical protein VP1G_09649 [Valsa mali var. pyri (nom. inval.)]
MKEDKEVIAEFNEYVNVTASELEKWLKSDDSSKAGWHKDGGNGESVGQESGHKIVEILKANPDKDPEKYTDDQIQHMRKVASYCKRHLAQESQGLEEKDPEEAKKTKSYISLMNWGHDPLKALGKGSSKSGKGGSRSASKNEEIEEGDEEGEEEEEEEEEGKAKEEEESEHDVDKAEEDDKKAGDKRKKPTQENGANKKRETRKGQTSKKDNDEEEERGDDEDNQEDDDYEEYDGHDSTGGKPSSNGPKKGEMVSWNWGSGNPHGKVLDVKEGEYVYICHIPITSQHHDADIGVVQQSQPSEEIRYPAKETLKILP